MVDILLATYNGEKYISEQIDSILSQDYKDWKIFIRDDGSTDSTIRIIDKYLKEYPGKIQLIDDIKGNIGVKLNFGELIQYSKSEYCMFCDQDDVWLSNKISLTLEKMKKIEIDKTVKIPILVHTDLKVVDKNLELISDSIWKYMKLDKTRNTLNKLLVKTTVTGCTMMINSSLREIIYDIPKDCIMHDYWIALVASSCGIIEWIDTPTILYRQHGNNQVGTGKMSFFKKLIENIKDGRYKFNTEEARILYQDYTKFISQENKNILKDFIELDKCNCIKKRYILVKNNYFTNNIFRNIRIFLFC